MNRQMHSVTNANTTPIIIASVLLLLVPLLPPGPLVGEAVGASELVTTVVTGAEKLAADTGTVANEVVSVEGRTLSRDFKKLPEETLVESLDVVMLYAAADVEKGEFAPIIIWKVYNMLTFEAACNSMWLASALLSAPPCTAEGATSVTVKQQTSLAAKPVWSATLHRKFAELLGSAKN